MRDIKFLVGIGEGTKWEWCDFEKALSEDYIKFNDGLIEGQDNSVIIRQYTGLKDKNLEDIYFDDIIKHQEYLYQIVWNYDKIGFKQIKTTINDFSQYTDGGECLKKDYGRIFETKDLFNFNNCEIIGNVYETPNLITK